MPCEILAKYMVNFTSVLSGVHAGGCIIDREMRRIKKHCVDNFVCIHTSILKKVAFVWTLETPFSRFARRAVTGRALSRFGWTGQGPASRPSLGMP
jgi:hypothetical protein